MGKYNLRIWQITLGRAGKFRIRSQLLLLTLAFAITTGSVMSPMGNPQNLLVAINSGMASPFVLFARYLLLPTLVCLIVPYVILKLVYTEDFPTGTLVHEAPVPGELAAMVPVKISLAIILILAAANIIGSFFGGGMVVSLPFIAILAAIPVLVLSARRVETVRVLPVVFQWEYDLLSSCNPCDQCHCQPVHLECAFCRFVPTPDYAGGRGFGTAEGPCRILWACARVQGQRQFSPAPRWV